MSKEITASHKLQCNYAGTNVAFRCSVWEYPAYIRCDRAGEMSADARAIIGVIEGAADSHTDSSGDVWTLVPSEEGDTL